MYQLEFEKKRLEQDLERERLRTEKFERLIKKAGGEAQAAATDLQLQVHLAQKKDATLKTSEIYSLDKPLPARFDRPASWEYKVVKQHPCFMTTSNQYGSVKPTAWEMPITFNGMTNSFTETLNQAGPYRNCSLNMKLK